ncbi:MAG TPA: trehalose-phosphatase [Bryobacteraceae bacterium]|nr:trehalose-phosphatase [Bryobacteraceae bacterium]
MHALLDVPSLLAAYRRARKRLLLIDYDGTLVGFYDHPDDAIPPRDLVNLLSSLSSAEENSVLLVSGRKRGDLDRWFGHLQRLWLAPEHGALLRRAGSTQWEPLRPDCSRASLERVRPTLERFVERVPGSFIEEKEFSLVWHYRKAKAALGDSLAGELLALLAETLADTELHAIPGSKIVEIRPAWANKGAVAARFGELCGPAEFQLAVGDDRTDEDMFQALNPASWTVHVGHGPTCARFTLATPADVVDLLRRLV